MQDYRQFYADNLVEPVTLCGLQVENDYLLAERTGGRYYFENHVPVFIESRLTPHQLSEYQAKVSYILDARRDGWRNRPEFCWRWSLAWLNGSNGEKARIICIGGSFQDDLPHIISDHKFNADHLAHEYVKLVPEILLDNVKHVACTSEKLPFRSNWADFVYSRNSLDHLSNPIGTILEAHRTLAQDGWFLICVYYNSDVINEHESTCIDDEFIERYIKPVFEIRQMWVDAGMVHIAAQKTDKPVAISSDEIRKVTMILGLIHSGLYYERTGLKAEAMNAFRMLAQCEPVLQTDIKRIQYAKDRLK